MRRRKETLRNPNKPPPCAGQRARSKGKKACFFVWPRAGSHGLRVLLGAALAAELAHVGGAPLPVGRPPASRRDHGPLYGVASVIVMLYGTAEPVTSPCERPVDVAETAAAPARGLASREAAPDPAALPSGCGSGFGGCRFGEGPVAPGSCSDASALGLVLCDADGGVVGAAVSTADAVEGAAVTASLG